MRIPGLKSFKYSTRWLRSRVMKRGLILGYHRVEESAWDPFGLCVSPNNFAEQLAVLNRRAAPVSLREMSRGLIGNSLPSGAVAVTFDDGYADLLYQAKPQLERYEVPSTAFVVSGCLGREFWWDELARLLAPERVLPGDLELNIEGRLRRWRLGSEIDGDRRRRLAVELHGLLLRLPDADRGETIEQLFAAVGSPYGSTRNRVLDRDELLQLTRGGLVEIGAHTETHPLLAELHETVQREEIQNSKRSLEEILDRPVTGFSYPNGAVSDRTQAIVRGSGFECACSSEPDIVCRTSDPFRLPRFWVPDCDGAQFERWLARWLQ